MIDHFVVLTPLLLLPIVLLFAFVGCAFQTHGLDLEPALLIHPDVLGPRLIKSVSVTFTLKSNQTFFSDQVSKTVTTWNVADSVENVSIPWDQVSAPGDNGPFTVTCDVTVVDNNDYHSVLPTAEQSGLGPESIFPTFELLPSDENPSGTFAVQNAS
jgi:hypothetical protein